MLYNDNVVRSPNFGPLLAAPLFSCIASHQAHGLRNHRDGTQATTESSEILARELIVACTAWSIVTVSVVIAVFLGLAIQDTAAQQAALEALFSELLMFAESVGQFDPGGRSQVRGADASLIPLLATAEPNAGWEEIGAGSASSGGISDNGGGLCIHSVVIAPDGMPCITGTMTVEGAVKSTYNAGTGAVVPSAERTSSRAKRR